MTRSVLDLVRPLRTRENRDAAGLYTIEGVRFLVAAADAGADVIGLVVCKRLLTSVVGRMIVRRLRRGGVPTELVDEAVFGSVTRLREGTGRGVIAVVRQRWAREPHIGRRDSWLAVDAIRSPGNLGTLLRTSVALGVRGVFVVGDTDPFDPSCVRATMGALASLEIARTKPRELIALSRGSGATLIGATPAIGDDFRAHRYPGSTVLLIGSERTGLRDELRDGCDALVRIPMSGRVDSLNAAVAGSLVLYEIFSRTSGRRTYRPRGSGRPRACQRGRA